jgi:recombination protein RecA
MAKKVKEETEEKIGSYFLKEKPLDFISSGCTLLDLVLSGGYPLGRVVNIIGDSSSGKSLLAIEAFANFSNQYSNGKMYYMEAEAAFDLDYAKELGFPENAEHIQDINTIELFFTKLDEIADFHIKEKVPGIVVLDSLDALSDDAELERDIDKGSYGAEKAKKLGQLFRRIVKKLEKAKICLIIISQTRQKIGVMFGEKYSVSGGKALQFYATHRLWLSEIHKLKKIIKKIERPYGIQVKAKCKKNKIGMPFRECEFPIIFGYGVHNILASLEWLSEINMLSELDIEKKDIKTEAERILIEKDKEMETKIEDLVKLSWYEIEETFAVKVKKYS